MQFYRDNKRLISLISYLLSVAVLIASLFPVHIHLHHSDASNHTSHEHVINAHPVFNDFNAPHDEHVSYHEIDTAPEAITKVIHSVSFDQILFTLLIILLAAVFRLVGRQTYGTDFTPLSCYYFLSPPLRAPPL